MIFEKLDDQTLASCRLVSKTFYNIIDKSKIIWTRIIHKHIGTPKFELRIQRSYQSRYHTPMLVILRLMEIQSEFRLVLLVCYKILQNTIIELNKLTRIKNENGDLIDLTQGDIESIKAQLSIEHISSLLKNDDIENIIADTQILSNLDIDQTNFEFSFGLNDYANFLGDFYGWEVNNYDELTNLANETFNANWTPEEYASAYQVQVDIVNALQSGEVGDFDAASIGAAIGASLDEAVEVIAAAGAAGVSVDLEAAAQGLGYDSFSAAVNAYNAANGTNYTDAQARKALGQ